jgi:hypothetical protein
LATSIAPRNCGLKVENAAIVATTQTSAISMNDFAITALSNFDATDESD